MRSLLFNCLTVLAFLCQGLRTWDCKENTDATPLLQLKWHLFCEYDVDVRPIINHRDPITVSILINIQHFTVYEVYNAVYFETFTSLIWNDSLLTWTPSKFAGIDKIHVMSNEMWLPDIKMHTWSNAEADISIPTTDCLVYPGKVLCVPKMVYPTKCEKDATWWPYDIMNCSVQISSWAYSTEDVYINLTNAEYSNETFTQVNNTEWSLMNITLSEHVEESKFGLGFKSKLFTCNVLLQRQSAVNSVNSIPIALALFAVTLITLWLEPKSNERMILANLNFILHLLALQHLAWTVPSNSGNNVPKIFLLYEDSFFLAIFALILTNILRHMHGLTVDAPSWISSASIFIVKSRIGQIFLVTISDPKVSAQMETSAEDNANLVSSDKKQSTWRYTSVLIGWISFIIVLFTYTILLAVKLPTSKSAYPVV